MEQILTAPEVASVKKPFYLILRSSWPYVLLFLVTLYSSWPRIFRLRIIFPGKVTLQRTFFPTLVHCFQDSNLWFQMPRSFRFPDDYSGWQFTGRFWSFSFPEARCKASNHTLKWSRRRSQIPWLTFFPVPGMFLLIYLSPILFPGLHQSCSQAANEYWWFLYQIQPAWPFPGDVYQWGGWTCIIE